MADFKAFEGLRNDIGQERFNPSDLAIAKNVDLDNTGKLLSREGYLKRIAGAVHSLWAHDDICLYVQGGTLKRLESSFTNSTIVRMGLTAGLTMSYSVVDGKVYYSNGAETGIYSNDGDRTWGIVPPVFQPLAVPAYGDMHAGTYQFAMTYARNDGQESGTFLSDKIDITTGAITFNDLPVSSDPSVSHKNIYLTQHNGDVLYRALTLANATTSIYYNGGILRTPLETQFMQNAPKGQIVGYYNGRMYVANGKFLYYSQAYGYELFDLRDYLAFTSDITIFAPVNDGIFIGTETQHVFLAGSEPKDFIQTEKANYGAVFGTLTYVHTNDMKVAENTLDETLPVWTSQEGVCTGFSGGVFKNITQDRYSFEPAQTGTAFYRDDGENNQYVVVLNR